MKDGDSADSRQKWGGAQVGVDRLVFCALWQVFNKQSEKLFMACRTAVDDLNDCTYVMNNLQHAGDWQFFDLVIQGGTPSSMDR